MSDKPLRAVLEQAVSDGTIRDFKIRGQVTTVWFMHRPEGQPLVTHLKNQYVADLLVAERNYSGSDDQ